MCMASRTATRRPTNVSLDAETVAEARTLGINVSQACEKGLVAELRRVRLARWKSENREAIESHNSFVERHGIPLARFRQF